MKTPLHIIFRRKARSFFNSFLSFILGSKKAIQETLDINTIHTIAIIRPNYRIGNLIFLTPLINEIAIQNPKIKIDIFVGMKAAGKILSPMPNVDQVIDIPRKLLSSPFELYKFIKKAREKKYDLTINISPASMSSQIVASLTNATYRLSYKNNKSWMPLTHVVIPEGLYTHSALNRLELLKVFGIRKFKHKKELDIKLSKEEINNASLELKNLLKRENIDKTDKTIIALFRNARYEKKIADTWWIEFVEHLHTLDKNIIVVDILSPDIPKKLDENVLAYSNKNLRGLAAFFRACDLYISADTGPLHLALASQTKVIALFNKTNPDSYGTLGKNNKTIDFNGMTAAEVAKVVWS